MPPLVPGPALGAGPGAVGEGVGPGAHLPRGEARAALHHAVGGERLQRSLDVGLGVGGHHQGLDLGRGGGLLGLPHDPRALRRRPLAIALGAGGGDPAGIDALAVAGEQRAVLGGDLGPVDALASSGGGAVAEAIFKVELDLAPGWGADQEGEGDQPPEAACAGVE